MVYYLCIDKITLGKGKMRMVSGLLRGHGISMMVTWCRLLISQIYMLFLDEKKNGRLADG